MSDFPTSLLTGTPEEGFDLAVKLSRLAVRKTQPDRDILKQLRPAYDQNAPALIAVSHVVAVNFQTIATINKGWTGSLQKEPEHDKS